MSLTIVVTGSRSFPDSNHGQNVCDKILEDVVFAWGDAKNMNDVTLWHGGARGFDLVMATAANRWGFKVVVAAATWEEQGRRAGPLRNARMLEHAEPDVVVAMLVKEAENKGTLHCIHEAKMRRIPVLEFTYCNGNGLLISVPTEFEQALF